jgi:SET domain-containing protein
MKQTGRRPKKPFFEVRHSRVHGRGVFALRRIRKGTNIIEYLGERVSHELADERYAGKDPMDGHTFLFTVDAKTVIDAGVSGNEARFVNHGCDPNCQTVQIGKRIFIEAIRTIRPGEELAYDYRIQRDADDPADVDIVFRCLCGAKNCRGSMLVARPKRGRKKRPNKRAKQRARKRAQAPKRRQRTR